jgi:DNA polymerase-3 subunit delta'
VTERVERTHLGAANDDARTAQAAETERVLPAAYPWQGDALADVLAGREALTHALLIVAPRGHGKSVFALHLARALLCEAQRPGGLACGTCPACHFVAIGQHPDLHIVAPAQEDEAEGTVRRAEWIAIDQIRELIGFVQLTSYRQRAKVAVIDPADRLNAEAANALLKTLEEPPGRTFLLLVTSRPLRLPATVRSRCRRISAPVARSAEAAEWLRASGVDAPDLALAQAGGAPLLAFAMADPGLQALRRSLLSALADPGRLAVSATGAALEAVPRNDRRARLALVLYWLAGWTADLSAAAVGGKPRYCPDFGRELAALGRVSPPRAVSRLYREVLRETGLASHPLSPRLVLERLLLQYRAVFVSAMAQAR